MASSVLPFHHVNTMTGTKFARMIEDPSEYAHLVNNATRPLLVIGSWALKVPNWLSTMQWNLLGQEEYQFVPRRIPRKNSGRWGWNPIVP